MNNVQNKCMEILREIDRVCQSENLQYYLYAGSLLGAVRHKGFIPWDDDIDVVMFRKDYDKFIHTCKEKLDKDKFELQTIYSDPYGNNSWNKLHLKNTAFISGIRRDGAMEGINIDIFPIDNVPDQAFVRKIRGKIIDFFNLCYSWRFAYHFPKPTWKMRIFRFFISLIPPWDEQKYKEMYDQYIQKYNNKETKNVVYLSNRKYLRKVIPRSVFNKTVFLDFEGEKFPCPGGYKRVLTSLYGKDYMKPPPKKQQVTGHGTCVIDLDHSWREYKRVNGVYEKI